MKILRDKYIRKLFRDEELRDFVLDVISLATNIPLENLKENFQVIDVKIAAPNGVKDMEADYMAEFEKGYINFEFNFNLKGTYTMNKNFSYICAIVLKQIKKGKNKNYDLKPITQINLNAFDLFKKGKFIYESVMMEKTLCEPRGNIVTIYDINLEYLFSLSYNEIVKLKSNTLEKRLYFIICDDLQKLKDLYMGDKIMEKVTEKIDNLETNCLDEFFYYDKEEILKHDSYELGQEDGREETRIENAKALLENDVDKQVIIKALKLTENEIKTLGW